MQEETKKTVRISVRNLVEFILRSGSIVSGKKLGDKDAMLLGGKIHRKIQRSMGGNYQAEVALRQVIEYDHFAISIEGRADGIFTEQDTQVIDEIKGMVKPVSGLEEPQPLHLAQAKCYAYIYGSQKKQTQMDIQVTYCHMETEEIKRFRDTYAMEDLETWFLEVVNAYAIWVRFSLEWAAKRNGTIQELEFPFSYREGQRELVTSVYRTILRKKKIFIQAPTGIGKTMATIFPTVKAVGEGLGEKVFYLTAKTITRTVAEQAFATLREQKLCIKTLTLTAKEKICPQEQCECNPESCPYAEGHFDRVNDAVFSLLTMGDAFTREVVLDHAIACRVCPFEMMLDLSLWVDAIIGDYNYLFDPNAQLKRFFGEGNKGEYFFLVDEAHNLVERGREMYSASLCKEEFHTLKLAVQDLDKKLYKRLHQCDQYLLELKKECETYCVLEHVGGFSLKLMNLMMDLERVMEDNLEPKLQESLLDLYFKVRDFLNIHDRLDEHYVIYSEYQTDGRFQLKLFCVNPSANIEECLARGSSTVFFSATLLPIQYYKQLLSPDPDNYAIYVESPFQQEKRLLIRCGDVSTKYTRRSKEMYQRYATYIQNIVDQKQGKYMVFFPSYAFLESVYDQLEERQGQCIMKQESVMQEAEREAFLSVFQEMQTESVIGFCVMGGIFSEGIDLTADQLIGVMLVGTGLPGVSREREILQNYFQQEIQKGFDYAYLYPGMNKVLQSAGRVIRTTEDEGIIALLDERFFQRQYEEIFPREWNDMKSAQGDQLLQQIKNFWEQAPRN